MKSKQLTEELEKLEALRGRLPERKGGWVMGDSAYSYGFDIIREVLPQKTYFHMLVLNATGQMPEDRFCQWLEASYIGMSWPDPRIWCNTIGSLGATARVSPMASVMAGLISSESTLYGTNTNLNTITFIQECLTSFHKGSRLDSIIETKIRKGEKILHLPGYSRPIADGDIRVVAMLEYAESLGYEIGEHMQLALNMSTYLEKRYSKSMNLGGYMAAFFSDLGYTIEQSVYMMTPIVVSGVVACYSEDIQSPPNHFLPLRCDDIEYTGKAERSLPEC